jgi:hypothetical protein
VVGVEELGAAFVAGKVFIGEGGPGLIYKVRAVAAVEAGGEGLAEEVDCGWEFRSDGCLIVAKGADDDGIGGEQQGGQEVGGVADPGIEIGLGTLFEFYQAGRIVVRSGCQWKIWTEVIVRKIAVIAFYY